jgi:hypothetical protein
MLHPDFATAIAHEKQRDVRRAATETRLERLVRCRRSFLVTWVRSVSTRWADISRSRSAACCA